MHRRKFLESSGFAAGFAASGESLTRVSDFVRIRVALAEQSRLTFEPSDAAYAESGAELL